MVFDTMEPSPFATRHHREVTMSDTAAPTVLGAPGVVSPEESTNLFTSIIDFAGDNWGWLLLACIVGGFVAAIIASAAAPADENNDVEPPHRAIWTWLRKQMTPPKSLHNIGMIITLLICVLIDLVVVPALFMLNVQTMQEVMPLSSKGAMLTYNHPMFNDPFVVPVPALIFSVGFTVAEIGIPIIIGIAMTTIEKSGVSDQKKQDAKKIRGVAFAGAAVVYIVEFVASLWRGLIEGGFIQMGLVQWDYLFSGIVSAVVSIGIALVVLSVGMFMTYYIERKFGDLMDLLGAGITGFIGIAMIPVIFSGLIWGMLFSWIGNYINEDNEPDLDIEPDTDAGV